MSETALVLLIIGAVLLGVVLVIGVVVGLVAQRR
jgi:hypothetical protein